jgi:polyhydroxyalkanoate synthesis regulator phasin
VKVNRATLVLPLAGLLVVGGAGAVLATSGDVATGGTDTVVPAAESPSPDAGTTPTMKDTALTSVLDDLVADGTITSSQKTAILDALAAERTARHEARQAEREQLQGFLSDGVITQSEFDQLPEDSRIRELEDLLSNGGITTDELAALRGFGGRGGHGGGHGGGKWFGGGMGPDGVAPDASASPTTSS